MSDVGMNLMLGFVATFLMLLIRGFGLQLLMEFVSQLPRTVISAPGYLGGNSDNLTKYASCPKCHSVYPVESCTIVHLDRSIISRKCSFVKFPRHLQRAYRQLCDTLLMKTMRTSAGTTTLYPRQVFCYKKFNKIPERNGSSPWVYKQM